MQGTEIIEIFHKLSPTIKVCIVGFIGIHVVGIVLLLWMYVSDKAGKSNQFSKLKGK